MEAAFVSGWVINACVHIKTAFTHLSICTDADNEFTDNEDPELNLVSLSKMKHLGYSNYELPPLIREPEDRKLMRTKHLWFHRAAVGAHPGPVFCFTDVFEGAHTP